MYDGGEVIKTGQIIRKTVHTIETMKASSTGGFSVREWFQRMLFKLQNFKGLINQQHLEAYS